MNESLDQGMKESTIEYQIINHVAYEPDVMILTIHYVFFKLLRSFITALTSAFNPQFPDSNKISISTIRFNSTLHLQFQGTELI